MKALVLVSVTGIALGMLIFFALGMNPAKKSGYSNCVVAESEASFIGRNLKFEGNAERNTLKTELCVQEDQELDGADGPKSGRVRWVECLVGPDCDEAGMN